MTDWSELARRALEARKKAYAPYSHYLVGAALLAESGRVYTGCNIECASYSPTNCAERTALFKAVSEGERCFVALAVAGGREDETLPLRDYTTPCGVCRQMLREFDGGGLQILSVRSPEDYRAYTLAELLPEAFGPQNLR